MPKLLWTRLLAGSTLLAIGIGAGILLETSKQKDHPPISQPVVKPSCSDDHQNDHQGCRAKLEALKEELKLAKQELDTKTALIASEKERHGSPPVEVRQPRDRPRPPSPEQTALITTKERDRFVPYIPYREYRKYRFYKPYRSPKESMIGTESDCKENTFAQECIGTEAYCKAMPDDETCVATEYYCIKYPENEVCQGTAMACARNHREDSCIGTEVYCKTLSKPRNYADCRGTEIYCEKLKLNPVEILSYYFSNLQIG